MKEMTVRQAQDFLAGKWGKKVNEFLVLEPKDTIPQYNILVVPDEDY